MYFYFFSFDLLHARNLTGVGVSVDMCVFIYISSIQTGAALKPMYIYLVRFQWLTPHAADPWCCHPIIFEGSCEYGFQAKEISLQSVFF